MGVAGCGRLNYGQILNFSLFATIMLKFSYTMYLFSPRLRSPGVFLPCATVWPFSGVLRAFRWLGGTTDHPANKTALNGEKGKINFFRKKNRRIKEKVLEI